MPYHALGTCSRGAFGGSETENSVSDPQHKRHTVPNLRYDPGGACLSADGFSSCVFLSSHVLGYSGAGPGLPVGWVCISGQEGNIGDLCYCVAGFWRNMADPDRMFALRYTYRVSLFIKEMEFRLFMDLM